jgi:hypothetical protein
VVRAPAFHAQGSRFQALKLSEVPLASRQCHQSEPGFVPRLVSRPNQVGDSVCVCVCVCVCVFWGEGHEAGREAGSSQSWSLHPEHDCFLCDVLLVSVCF